MVKNSGEPVVLIIETDKDIGTMLAEQVQSILALPCVVVSTLISAQPLAPTLEVILSTQSLTEECALPVIHISPPVIMRELLQEIENVRHKTMEDDLVLARGYYLQMRTKTLTSDQHGKSVALTDKEVQLLRYLNQAQGNNVSKEYLLKAVWGMDAAVETHTLETHIYRLRSKFRELGDDEMIIAVDGGYTLMEMQA